MTSASQHRRACVLVLTLALGVVGVSCNRLWDWSLGPGRTLDEILPEFGLTNRIVIKQGYDVIRESRDKATVEDVVAFFRKYPSGWLSVSGAGGEYDILLYHDDRSVGRVRLVATSTRSGTVDTLTTWQYFRRAPAAEVAAFAKRLELIWPPHKPAEK